MGIRAPCSFATWLTGSCKFSSSVTPQLLSGASLCVAVLISGQRRTMGPEQAERLFKHLAGDARRAAAAKAAAADAVAAAKAAQRAARASNNADTKAAADKALEDAEAKQRAVERTYTSADDTDYSSSIVAVFLLSVMAFGVGVATLDDDHD